MDPDLGIIRLRQPLENNRQRFVGVDKNSAHWILHLLGCDAGDR